MEEENVNQEVTKSEVKKSEPKKGKGGKYAAVAALLLLLGGGGYGIGTGKFGIGDGSDILPNQNSSKEDSDTVIIRIEENTVTVNGTECKDAAELKALLEKLYTDDKIFVLEDEKAILASYEWVEETCTELGIDLKK